MSDTNEDNWITLGYTDNGLIYNADHNEIVPTPHHPTSPQTTTPTNKCITCNDPQCVWNGGEGHV